MADISTYDERYARWAIEYQEFLESGMSQVEWCKVNEVNLHTFQYRLSRLRKTFGKDNETGVPATEFVKLNAPSVLPDTEPEIIQPADSIVLETGTKRIRMEGITDKEVLRTVMEVFMNAE